MSKLAGGEWSKASAESLLPNGGDDRLLAMLLSIDPGGRTGSLPSGKGAREFAYCIQGQVRLALGSQHYELTKGDSALLTEPNASWENRGRVRAQIIVVSARVS